MWEATLLHYDNFQPEGLSTKFIYPEFIAYLPSPFIYVFDWINGPEALTLDDFSIGPVFSVQIKNSFSTIHTG